MRARTRSDLLTVLTRPLGREREQILPSKVGDDPGSQRLLEPGDQAEVVQDGLSSIRGAIDRRPEEEAAEIGDHGRPRSGTLAEVGDLPKRRDTPGNPQRAPHRWSLGRGRSGPLFSTQNDQGRDDATGAAEAHDRML